MADAKDIWVIESPKTLAIGESRAFTIDFTAQGTPTSIDWVKAFDASAVEQTSTVLSGSSSLTGAVATLKLFTPASEQVYRLLCAVTIGGQVKIGALDVACFDPVHAPGSSSSTYYGTPDGVAAIAPKFANRGGRFDDTTRPTHATILNMIAEVGSMVNAMLAQNGFAVPVTDSDVTPALRLFVNQEVAAMVEGVNGSGRFGPTVENRKGGRKSRFTLVLEDVSEFIESFAVGIEALGATRSRDTASGIGFRSTDEAGDDVHPLFQRKAFGNTSDNWDA